MKTMTIAELWEYLPEKWRYVARDKTRAWFVFEGHPAKRATVWNTHEGECEYVTVAIDYAGTWEDSLHERPAEKTPEPTAEKTIGGKVCLKCGGPPLADANELIRHRFLCRGGAALLVGPTGAGKSSFIMQAALTWTLGQPFLGLGPARALRVTIVQAENDDGDLADNGTPPIKTA